MTRFEEIFSAKTFVAVGGGRNFIALGLEDTLPAKLHVLHNVRVPQPCALLRHLPWEANMALARLGKECVAGLLGRLAMARHSAFSRDRNARIQAV